MRCVFGWASVASAEVAVLPHRQTGPPRGCVYEADENLPQHTGPAARCWAESGHSAPGGASLGSAPAPWPAGDPRPPSTRCPHSAPHSHLPRTQNQFTEEFVIRITCKHPRTAAWRGTVRFWQAACYRRPVPQRHELSEIALSNSVQPRIGCKCDPQTRALRAPGRQQQQGASGTRERQSAISAR
jgi:hypothetical protein